VNPSTFDDWARRHHGLITFEASGLSRAAWYRAIEAGKLLQIHPYVAQLPGTEPSPRQRIAAAVLAIGDGTLASHRSAAQLWGVERPPHDPVDVLCPRVRHGARLSGVVIHHTTDSAHLTPQRRFGVRCTNILRTLVDLGAVDASGVSGAVGHALATRRVDLPALEATVMMHGRSGRSGVQALRRAIDDWSIDAKPADSTLENAMRRLVQRYRLPLVEFHPRIAGCEVDFRVTGTVVILECDGWAYHGLIRSTFERDRDRDAHLTSLGWVVVRFTYRSITAAPAKTARRITETIDRWSHVRPPDAR
jgi:very-short-patch-repair endonuclease